MVVVGDVVGVVVVVGVDVAVVVVSTQLSHMTGQCARTNALSTAVRLQLRTVNRAPTPQSAGSCRPLQTPCLYVVVGVDVCVVVVVGVVVVVAVVVPELVTLVVSVVDVVGVVVVVTVVVVVGDVVAELVGVVV